MELLNVVENILPIGGDSWTAVQNEYNKFAKLNGQPEWDGCLLKQKYEKVGPLCWCVGIPPSPHIQLVHAAKEKPTGEANHSELLEMALWIEEALDIKSGSALLDDNLFEGDSKGESEAGGVPDRRKVIHLTSDGDSAGEESSKTKPVKSNCVVKGFHTANPLQFKPCKTWALHIPGGRGNGLHWGLF